MCYWFSIKTHTATATHSEWTDHSLHRFRFDGVAHVVVSASMALATKFILTLLQCISYGKIHGSGVWLKRKALSNERYFECTAVAAVRQGE